MSEAIAAALKKLAASAATDKNVAKAVGTAIAVALVALISPLLVILALLNSGSQVNISDLEAQSQNEQLQYFETVMQSIEDEIAAQNSAVDPMEAQVIYLCALQGREDEPDFYANYITCFAESQDPFEQISAVFGVAYTPQDVERIGQLIASAQAAQTGPSNGIHAKIAELTANDMPGTPGAFLSPLRVGDWKTIVTSGFGRRVHPITGEPDFHTGIDFGVTEGTAIYPAKAGTVLMVGRDDSGYGLYLVVDHGGGEATLYAHCSKILVTEGDEVTTEIVIAKSGNSGASTGPHLHFEVVQNGVPQNPQNYLQKEGTH
jgi:murein DD-endopeptidase MepM/ murein hydrolase activator NlpD